MKKERNPAVSVLLVIVLLVVVLGVGWKMFLAPKSYPAVTNAQAQEPSPTLVPLAIQRIHQSQSGK